MSDGCARTGMRFSGGAKRASRQGGPGREPERPGSLRTSAGVAVMIHHARGAVRPPEPQMSSIPSLVPRDRYAALARCTYLNQAALGLIPVPTIDAMETFLKETAQFGNLYLSDDQEAAILDGVRSAGAEVLGTSSGAVAVVAGASEGLGQVTSLLEPEHGTVLLVGSDFPSVTYPWLAAAERRGIQLRFVDDRAHRDLTQDLVDALDPTVTVVAFSVVPYATGARGRPPCRRGRAAARRCGGRRHHRVGCGRAGAERLQVAVGPWRRGAAGARSRSGAAPPRPGRAGRGPPA